MSSLTEPAFAFEWALHLRHNGDLINTRSASFSPNEAYRYHLVDANARIARPRLVNFLMLNPSTADECKNDPTVERCQRRALRGGFDGFVITNLFALRATDPRVMRGHAAPVDHRSGVNDRVLLDVARTAEMVVCAWGVHGRHRDRGAAVASMLRREGIPLYVLALCGDGQPGHPLMLSYDLLPRLWTP